MAKKRCLMVGAGGMAGNWIRDFWTPFRDRMDFAALVDVNPDVLQQSADILGLGASQRFTDMEAAFSSVEADFCCIVTPPGFHRAAVERACARGLDILSEKPIADTWESCCAVYHAVEQAGVKMMVTQNYRYTPRIVTLRKAIAELGPINFIVSRYATDWRERNEGWYLFKTPHSNLVDCAVHHFDQIRNLTGADCRTISGYSWNPEKVRGPGASFRGGDAYDGDACSLFSLSMNDGTFAQYEGSNIASGTTNSWNEELYRVECEGGAAILDRDDVVRIIERESSGASQEREIQNVELEWTGHKAIAAQFVTWLEGGPAPTTVIADNIRSNAIMFAAIEAKTNGTVVDVGAMLEKL